MRSLDDLLDQLEDAALAKQDGVCDEIRSKIHDLVDNPWIPCSKRLPDDYHAVNVTWVNRDPEPYYMHIKDKPFTATACYHNRKWYWYSSVIEDLIAEYDGDPLAEIDDGIEIIAWMPLPEVYAEEVNKCG